LSGIRDLQEGEHVACFAAATGTWPPVTHAFVRDAPDSASWLRVTILTREFRLRAGETLQVALR